MERVLRVIGWDLKVSVNRPPKCSTLKLPTLGELGELRDQAYRRFNQGQLNVLFVRGANGREKPRDIERPGS